MTSLTTSLSRTKNEHRTESIGDSDRHPLQGCLLARGGCTRIQRLIPS